MSKIVYVGAFLDPASIAMLKTWWITKIGKLHPEIKIDHLTFKFGPSQSWLEEFPFEFGTKVTLKVIGYAEDEKCQAVLIDIGNMTCDNKYPHITVAVNGVPPKYSNQLFDGSEVYNISGPELMATIDSFPRSL